MPQSENRVRMAARLIIRKRVTVGAPGMVLGGLLRWCGVVDMLLAVGMLAGFVIDLPPPRSTRIMDSALGLERCVFPYPIEE